MIFIKDFVNILKIPLKYCVCSAASEESKVKSGFHYILKGIHSQKRENNETFQLFFQRFNETFLKFLNFIQYVSSALS